MPTRCEMAPNMIDAELRRKIVSLNILELLTQPDGLPRMENSSIKFESADHAIIGGMPRISKHENCGWQVFVELAPGFVSEGRSADIDQLFVCLSGVLSIAGSDGVTQNLEPGNIARLRKSDSTVYSKHILTVVGEEPVQLMVVKFD